MRFLVFFACWIVYFNISAQPADAEVTRLARTKFEWFKTHQFDSIKALIDENLQYIHSNAWTEHGEELIKNLQSGKLVYKKVSIEDLNVRLWNRTTAIVTGKGWFEGTNTGIPFGMRLLFTEVYVKQNGRWKLINRHACRIPE